MNRAARDRFVLPLLIPIGAMALIGVLVIAFSRVLLSITSHAATATALVVALSIMAAAAVLSRAPKIRASSLAVMLGAVAGAAMFAGGIAVATIGSGAAEEGGGKAEQPAGVPVAISAAPGASSEGFAETKLSAPAGKPLTIQFDNQDPGITHNVDVYSDKAFTTSIAKTDIVAGPAKVTAGVAPLDAGTYYFRCDVHPTTMTGELEAKAGAPAGGAAESPSAGAGASPAAAGEGSPPAGGAPSGGPVNVTASNLAFDTSALTLPSSGRVTIHFQNNDAGLPHNLAIYSSNPAEGGTELFKGELVTGPASTDYRFDALPAGTYYFQCDVHPATMNGTVKVA